MIWIFKESEEPEIKSKQASKIIGLYLNLKFSSKIQKCKYLNIVAILPKIVKKKSNNGKAIDKKKEPVSIESSEGRMWTTFNAQ